MFSSTAVAMQQIRRESGLTQNELAQLIGVPVRLLRTWEYGERTMKLEYIVMVSDALEIPADQLILASIKDIRRGKSA